MQCPGSLFPNPLSRRLDLVGMCHIAVGRFFLFVVRLSNAQDILESGIALMCRNPTFQYPNPHIGRGRYDRGRSAL